MIVVTGGAGFIGYHLAKSLSDEGKEILIIDNLRGKMDEYFANLIQKDNIVYRDVDLTNYDEVKKVLDTDIDEIYHLAAVNGTNNFYENPDL